MNKRYDKTDQERHESRRLEQEQAEKQKSRQIGNDPRRSDRQQAGHESHRQEGGWQTEEDRSASVHEDRSGRKMKPDEEKTSTGRNI